MGISEGNRSARDISKPRTFLGTRMWNISSREGGRFEGGGSITLGVCMDEGCGATLEICAHLVCVSPHPPTPESRRVVMAPGLKLHTGMRSGQFRSLGNAERRNTFGVLVVLRGAACAVLFIGGIYHREGRKAGCYRVMEPSNISEV